MPTDPALDAEQLDPADKAQLEEVRQRLHRDAAIAGINEGTLEASITRAVAKYAQARVRSFIGVLVEREVRDELSLPPSRDQV